MGQYTTWEGAVAEALRLNRVAHQKFGGEPSDWVYRVRRRRTAGSRHLLWKVYTPGYRRIPGLTR